MNDPFQQRALTRIDLLIEKGMSVLKTFHTSDVVIGASWVDTEKFSEWRGQSLAFLTRFLGQTDMYTNDFRERVNKHSGSTHTEIGLGLLRAVREDIADGYLATMRELVHGDVYSDFLDMAEYLHSEGYKDPAAVLAGGVLEEHLRQLCRKHGLDVEVQSGSRMRPKKADAMNAELARAGTYSVSDQKSVTAWLDVRNLAAHGRYSEYSAEQVTLLMMGLREFIARVPA